MAGLCWADETNKKLLYASNVENENGMEIRGDEVKKCGARASTLFTLRFAHVVYFLISAFICFYQVRQRSIRPIFDNILVSIEQFWCVYRLYGVRGHCERRGVRLPFNRANTEKLIVCNYACQPCQRPPENEIDHSVVHFAW